ncbi:hypothetical protein CBM2587_B10121 [Cupriavidus taiwanensis]|uniref:Uncharacterized protein n=1 Tax=Cupriavidus taiwanensis TaxID=164546 RepID=A0A375BXJ2_9BURK|nr:hypothetical protein CBM2587_B10121 [Cupriavidus taiwanensis]
MRMFRFFVTYLKPTKKRNILWPSCRTTDKPNASLTWPPGKDCCAPPISTASKSRASS